MRRRRLFSFVLLLGLSLVSVTGPALADHSNPVLTYTPSEGPEGTVINFTIAGCKEADPGPRFSPETDITISLFPSSFGGGDQRNFDIAADDEQVSGTLTVRTRAEYAASTSNFDGRTIFLGVVCWEGGDPAPFDEFIITDAPAPGPAPSPTSTILPPAVSPETQSQAEVSDATVAPGEQVNVVGGGFAPDRDLRIDLLSDPIFLGSTRSDSGGRFAARVTIPSNASPGPHRIVVSGPGPGGGTHRSIATVNVVMTVARPLARTGASSAGLIRLAILSASVGLALLVCTERRLVTIATIGLGRGPRSARRKHSTIWRGARPRRWPLI